MERTTIGLAAWLAACVLPLTSHAAAEPPAIAIEAGCRLDGMGNAAVSVTLTNRGLRTSNLRLGIVAGDDLLPLALQFLVRLPSAPEPSRLMYQDRRHAAIIGLSVDWVVPLAPGGSYTFWARTENLLTGRHLAQLMTDYPGAELSVVMRAMETGWRPASTLDHADELQSPWVRVPESCSRRDGTSRQSGRELTAG